MTAGLQEAESFNLQALQQLKDRLTMSVYLNGTLRMPINIIIANHYCMTLLLHAITVLAALGPHHAKVIIMIIQDTTVTDNCSKLE